ncbi:MAG: Alpha/beta hydrolase fold-3 [Rhizobium sp.]|nr:Alpha/beta hydrolase fold-3 [Rhizobium sp.]
MTMALAIRLRNKGKGGVLKGLLFNYAGFASDCSDEAEALHGGPGFRDGSPPRSTF